MKEERVIQVFVGSPGDVAEERERAFSVIENVNKDRLLPPGWRFEAVGWDRTHYPKLAWLSPQEAITEGIPRPGGCDIAVFVFWKRIGTPLPPDSFEPNGAGDRPTGSLWEYHDAMGAEPRPWALVYHRTTAPTMTDRELADPIAFAEQLKGVQDFLAGFQDEQQRFRNDHYAYSDPDDFARHLEQDLKAFIKAQTDKSGRGKGGSDRATAAPTERVPRAYLQRLKAQVARVELLGLDLKESITNGLPQIYVPAMVTATRDISDRPDADYQAVRREIERHPNGVPLLHRLGEHSLYVPGAPGSGKSTFCQWVAYLVAHGGVPAHEIPTPEGFEEWLPEGLRGRLPVLIRLCDFWGHMACGRDAGDWSQRQLEAAVSGWLTKKEPFGLTAAVFQRNLAEGNLLLLLDGVDEVPEVDEDGAQTTYPRRALLSGLTDALLQWLEQNHRVLVTSRPYGLGAAERARLGLEEVGLLPLDEELQRLFVARWYAAADHAHWQTYAEGLAEELRNRPELQELKVNPLLLTALCVKFKEGKRLPQDLFHLYDSVVNQVLYNRFRGSDRERSRVRWRLEAVALGMHLGIDRARPRPAPLASVERDELDRILAAYAKLNPSTEGDAEQVAARRDELLERSGLLLPRGERTAEFYHQDFRDYLAAERWAREG